MNHLIALDKCPGVRTIGIGETLWRVISKAVCYATRVDVELACGSDQMLDGVRSGIEGAIYTMSSLFCNMVLFLVGAYYLWMHLMLLLALTIFHCILWNMRVLWPCCCTFVFNTYQGQATLVVRGSNENLSSMEGVTQRDLLSM